VAATLTGTRGTTLPGCTIHSSFTFSCYSKVTTCALVPGLLILGIFLSPCFIKNFSTEQLKPHGDSRERRSRCRLQAPAPTPQEGRGQRLGGLRSRVRGEGPASTFPVCLQEGEQGHGIWGGGQRSEVDSRASGAPALALNSVKPAHQRPTGGLYP